MRNFSIRSYLNNLFIFGLIYVLAFLCSGCYEEPDPEEELPDPDEIVLLVADAINERRYSEAIELLETLREHPEGNHFYATYAEAFLKTRLGIYDEALVLVNSLDPGPYNHDLLELRSEILNSMGNLPGAERDLETMRLARREGSSYIEAAMWEIALELGDLDLATLVGNEITSNPNPDIFDMFTMFSMAIHDRDFIRAEQIIERLPSVPGVIQSGTLGFHNPNIQMKRAELMFERGEVNRALEILAGLPSTNQRLTSSWIRLAGYAIHSGRYDYARSSAIEGIVKSCGQDILDEIGIEYDESLVTDAGEPMRHTEVASLLVIIGLTSIADGNALEAGDCADKALEVNPYQVSAYGLLSSVWEFPGDIDMAIDEAVRGMIVSPYNRELALRYVRLAKIAPHAVGPSDPDPRIVLVDLLERAEDRHDYFPDDPDVAYLLARILDIAGEEPDRRFELLKLAYEDSPHVVEYVLDYAVALAESDKCEEAGEILESSEIPMDMAWIAVYRNSDHSEGAEEMCGFDDMIKDAMGIRN